MIHVIEAYLAVRRIGGFELKNDDYLLRSYARFAVERGEDHVRSATAIESMADSLRTGSPVLGSEICSWNRSVSRETPSHRPFWIDHGLSFPVQSPSALRSRPPRSGRCCSSSMGISVSPSWAAARPQRRHTAYPCRSEPRE